MYVFLRKFRKRAIQKQVLGQTRSSKLGSKDPLDCNGKISGYSVRQKKENMVIRDALGERYDRSKNVEKR